MIMQLSFILCFVWGLVSLLAMLLTKRFYIPFLEARLLEDDKKAEVKNNLPRISNKAFIFIIIICAVFSAFTGFLVSGVFKSSIISGLIVFTLIHIFLSCIFITDMQLKIIPNLCIIIMLCLKAVTLVVDYLVMDRETFFGFLINCIVTSIVCVIFLLIMSKVTHGGIGMGDIKLLGIVGLFCGAQILFYTVIFSLIFASLFSLFLLILKKKSVKDRLPLGPLVWAGYQICCIVMFLLSTGIVI